MRAVLIGPVLPIRGGIAHHTSMLRRTLASKCELRTYSYRRQYPEWLYPGNHQTEAHLEDYREPAVDYALDGKNPLSWLSVTRQVRAYAPDLVILPWWTVYWAPMYLVFLTALRTSNARIVLIAHNVVDHESGRLKRLLTRLVLKRSDGILVHNRTAADETTRLLGDGRTPAVHPHPIYTQFPQSSAKLPRRASLEILFFGFVRSYKGLDLLLEALARLKRQDWRLSIVGEFWREAETRTRARIECLHIAQRVEMIPHYVPDTEAAEYFGRTDLVVLPYVRSNGSGVIPLAYHYNKPVVVSDIGSLADMVVDGETGWHFEAESASALCDVLSARTATESKAMVPAIEALKARWTWSTMAESILSL